MQLRITTAGRAALLNADNSGTKAVRIAQIGLTKTSFTPKADGSDIALPGEFKRLTTFAGKATSNDTIHVTVRDESADVYQLRGMALYLDNGVLFGLYGQAAVILEKAGPAMMLLSADVKFATVNASQITFGNADFINPNATTETYGVVELATISEAEGGTDDVRAVTPRGLKAFIDKRFGATAPTTFARNLLALSTSATFRAALEIKGAALKDEGAGNGLDADTVDGKHAGDFAAAAHTHSIANVTGLQVALDGKAATAHAHTIDQVTGLSAALNAKVDNQGVVTGKTYDDHFAQSGAAVAYHAGTQAPTDAPVGAQQHSVMHLGNQWGRTQLAFPNNAQRMFFRNGVGKVWAEAWHSLNFDPASKANIAGATFTGNIAAPQVKASGGHFIGNATYTLIAPAGTPANGVIYLRPGGDGDRAAELRVEAGGITFANKETVWHSGIFKPADKADLTGANTWTSRQTFNGGVSIANDRLTDIGTGGATLRGTSEGSVVLASGGKETGHVYLRPNGNTDTSGQVVVYGTGVLAAPSAKLTASGDGAVMLDLAGERSWQFRQSGTAGNAALELFDATGGKEFRLSSTANASKIVFNPTGSWITAAEFRGGLVGNAATASKLSAPRAINGTNFDGSAAITTATWGTPRNITIGNSAKSVNGSAAVSWTLGEIGAAAAGHGHGVADVSGLQPALDAKASVSDLSTRVERGSGSSLNADGTAPAGYFSDVKETLALKYSTNTTGSTGYPSQFGATLSVIMGRQSTRSFDMFVATGDTNRLYFRGYGSTDNPSEWKTFGMLQNANSWIGKQTFGGGAAMPNDVLLTLGSGGGSMRGGADGSLIIGASATTGSGIRIRPNGESSLTGQIAINSDGVVAAPGFSGPLSGNATTATTAGTAAALSTPRSINGTSFNGSANIVTNQWGAARNIQIGAATKAVNGSANVAWTLGEMGAASVSDMAGKVGFTAPTNNDDSWLDAYDTYRVNRQTTVGGASMPAQYTMAINFPSYDGSRGLAMGFDYGGGNRFWMRSRRDTGGTTPGERWKDWVELYHSGNFNPASKANVSHTHAISDVGNLQAELNARPVNGGNARFARLEASGGDQGFQFLWNAVENGQGRNEYINNYGGGSGGHYFYRRSKDGDGLVQQAAITNGSAIWSAGGFDTGSSRKLKHIEGALPYGLAEVERMETAVGRYRKDYNDDDRRRLFFVAEQLAELVPEAVDMAGVEYNGERVASVKVEQLLPVFANAIRELSQRLRTVEARQ